MRQLVIARSSNRNAPQWRDQTVGISVLFTHVTAGVPGTPVAKRHSTTFQHSLDPLTDVSRCYRAEGPRLRESKPKILQLLRIPTLAFVADLIARRINANTSARSHTSSVTIWFLHASCHDYLADEHIVYTRRIRGCTGWTKKVREEEDDDQGVEEERKAHTRAWFQ